MELCWRSPIASLLCILAAAPRKYILRDATKGFNRLIGANFATHYSLSLLSSVGQHTAWRFGNGRAETPRILLRVSQIRLEYTSNTWEMGNAHSQTN